MDSHRVYRVKQAGDSNQKSFQSIGSSSKIKWKSKTCGYKSIYKLVPWKSFEISVHSQGKIFKFPSTGDQTILEVLRTFLQDQKIVDQEIFSGQTGVPLNLTANATLLDGDIIVLEDDLDYNQARFYDYVLDTRLQILAKMIFSEHVYRRTLKGVCSLYEKPLRKLLGLLKEPEHRLLFDWVEAFISTSSLLSAKLEMTVMSWDPETSRIGNTFTKQLWQQFEEYSSTNFAQATLLIDRLTMDEDFSALCIIHQGAAKHSLQEFLCLPLERLIQYDRHLEELLVETSPAHPDHNDICRAASKAKAMVRREIKREENDLDRVQDLFPHDQLRLYERDPISPRKGLLRTKSATHKLQRAFSGKSKTDSHQINSSTPVTHSQGYHEGNYRQFVMEGPVQFTIGVQSQERHLFLFQDFLLVAKPRPSGTFKLKEKVLICEIWLADCLDDVSETNKSSETSFVLGWPTTNAVVTFSSSRTKNLWKNKLEHLLLGAKKSEGLSLTSIHITYLDSANKQEYPKVLRITNSHTASDCIRLVLRQLCLQEEDSRGFQLWVQTQKEESPYPLIGHEFPFSIKMNLIRVLLQRSELDLVNLSHVTTETKCTFILRRHSQRANQENSYTSPTPTKKFRKPRRQTLLNWPFKRQVSKSDSLDSALPSSPCCLFSWPLTNSLENESLPLVIQVLLSQLYIKGPHTIGIFRKSANARLLRELKEKVDAASQVSSNSSSFSCLENASPIILASLLKEFLRCLPDTLLQSHLCYEWLDAICLKNEWQARENVLCLLSKLPPNNLLLLKYLLCVLHHIAQNSFENKMSAENLAVCIGPSLLGPVSREITTVSNEDISKKVPKVVAYLISNCRSLLGEDCLSLFDDCLRKESCRQDSGAEEEMDSLRENGNFHRDDSSTDSLNQFVMEECDPSPKPSCRTKVSLTNLSRDSGLTLSDTQLYTPEEEMESEFSSGGDSRKLESYAKSVPHLNTLPLEGETPTKSAGISIDGSCLEVVRKRRLLHENGRSQTLASIPYKNNYEEYSSPKSFVSLKLRHRKENSQLRRQVKSSLEPLQCYRNQRLLQRSASEESLLQKYGLPNFGQSLQNKRPAVHRKGRAPSPPGEHKTRYSLDYQVYRQPDPQAVWFANHSGTMDWKRSQSTSKIDQLDVPSNQGGVLKTVNSSNNDSASQSCGDIHIYENTRNMRYLENCSTTDQDCFNYSMKQEPPSYQEALNRRNILKKIQTGTSAQEVTDQMRQEQTSLSARAKQLYEESLKLYNNHQTSETNVTETHHAIPVQVSPSEANFCRSSPTNNKVTPNHQQVVKSLSDTSHLKCNSDPSGNNLRLRQLPPVHVTDAQINRIPKKRVVAFQRTWREFPDIPEDLKGGIHWSVAQLRTLFCPQSPTGLKKGVPPPYRPPPVPRGQLIMGKDFKRSVPCNVAEESFV